MKSVSGKELCKVIEKKGWVLKRINGSHYIYKKVGEENLVVIPVKIKTLNTVCSEA